MLRWKRFGWTKKDENYRKLFKNGELQKNILKSLLSSSKFPYYYKLYFIKKLHSYSKFMALSTYKRYCLFNYAGKVVSRRFKLGRHAVRLFGGQGYLSGLRKSSF